MDHLEWELLIEAEPGDVDTRVLLIEAELGDMFAQWELAAAYQIGKKIKKDLQKALKWYLKSAEQGFAIAQRSLGLMYFEGIGTEQDYNKAAEWFRKAGEQGDVDAQYYLGILLMTKGFIGRNFSKSYEWLLAAYQNGHNDAPDALLVLYHADGILWDCVDDSKNANISEIKVKDNLIFTCQDNTYSLTADEFEQILFEAGCGNEDAQYILGVIAVLNSHNCGVIVS